MYLCDVLTWLTGTTFPNIPFSVCFQVGWASRDIFAGDLESRSHFDFYAYKLEAGTSEVHPQWFICWHLSLAQPATASPCPWFSPSFPNFGPGVCLVSSGKGTGFFSRTPTKLGVERTDRGSNPSSWIPAHAPGFQLALLVFSCLPSPTACPIDFKL